MGSAAYWSVTVVRHRARRAWLRGLPVAAWALTISCTSAPIPESGRTVITDAPIDGFVSRRTTVAPGVTRAYRLFIPPNYDRRQRYPLVVWLHGAGGLGDKNTEQLDGDQMPGTRRWTDPTEQAARPAFVLAPQAWRSWHLDTDTITDPGTPLGTMLAIVRELQAEFSIDPTRLYLAGQSLGGDGALALIGSEANPFAAAIVVCPALNPRERPDLSAPRVARLGRMPMWIFIGELDASIIPVRSVVTAAKAAGGTPRYTEYAGEGHSIWERAFREEEIATWLFSQKRPGAR